MTLNISVVGKFHENSSDLCDKNDSTLYQMDEDDPNILPMDSPYEVMIIVLYGWYVFLPLLFLATSHIKGAGHLNI